MRYVSHSRVSVGDSCRRFIIGRHHRRRHFGRHRRRVAVDARHLEGGRHRRRDGRRDRCLRPVHLQCLRHRLVPRDRHAQRLLRSGADRRDRAARSHRRPAGLARAGRDERSGHGHVEPIRARGAPDSAARRDAFRAPAIEQSNPLSTGDALAGAVERHAGRQRAVRRAAAAARPRFDAHARARRRRASEHRPTGDRSHRRRGRPDLAGLDQPHRDRQRRRHAAVWIGCAGRHDQHHHQRAVVLADDAAALRLQRLSTARTRTAGAAP